MSLNPFLWGSKGEKLTPEQVARRQEQAAAMLKGVGDTSPVGHWLQGAGRVVNAITGKIQERRADASEKLGMAGADAYMQNNQVLAALLGGGGGAGGQAPSNAMAQQPIAYDQNETLAGDAMAALGKPTPATPEAIRSGLVARGLPEHVADGFVMNFQDESGLNPGINEANPTVTGSRGGFGLYQLTGPRRVAYEAFAADRGVDPSSVDAQLDFLMTELQGAEAPAARSILSASTAGEAGAAIVNDFLRPAPEHRSARAARYAGGGGMSSGGSPVPITGGGSNVVGALASAMSDPWVAKKYGPVLQALMGQEMRRGDMQYEAQLSQSDPMYQAQLAQLTAPKPREPINVGGVLLDPLTYQPIFDSRQTGPVDPFAGTKMVGDSLIAPDGNGGFAPVYSAPADPGFAMVTPDEVAALGLPPGAYQRGADGKISQVGGGGTTVNIDNGGGKFEEAFAKGDAATIGTVYDAGLAAQRNLGRIDQLEGLLTNSPTGMAGAAALAAGEWGINTDGLSEIQAAQAMINSLVPEQRQPGSGPMSDADLALFKQSLPRIINQPGGNKVIVDTMRAIAQYDADGAAIVQRLRNGELTRSEAFDALQNRPNPLAKPTGGAVDAGATGSVPAGVDPADWEFMTPEEKALFQ